jgi:hypothetical protein
MSEPTPKAERKYGGFSDAELLILEESLKEKDGYTSIFEVWRKRLLVDLEEEKVMREAEEVHRQHESEVASP